MEFSVPWFSARKFQDLSEKFLKFPHQENFPKFQFELFLTRRAKVENGRLTRVFVFYGEGEAGAKLARETRFFTSVEERNIGSYVKDA